LFFWLDALVCSSGLPSMAGFDAFHGTTKYFSKDEKYSKVFFAHILPCGLPAAIFKIMSSTGTR